MTRSDLGVRLVLAMLTSIAGATVARAQDGFGSSLSGTTHPQGDIAPSAVRKMIMNKINGMNAAKEGIFNEDVTDAVAPYFPPGQSLKDTESVIANEGLGTLRRFKGKQDPSKGTMYVTSFGMMTGMGSSVYVVINFEFGGTTHETMAIQAVKAFIRAKSM